MSQDIRIKHIDAEGSCPGIKPKKVCSSSCRKILIEWVKGPHDGLAAFICEKELIRKYPCHILKASRPGHCKLCRQPGCKGVLVQSAEGPLPGSKAWFCIREIQHIATP